MKKYLLFGGDSYYPRGGADDFIDSFDDIDDAKGCGYGFVCAASQTWASIADRDTMRTLLNLPSPTFGWYDPNDDE